MTRRFTHGKLYSLDQIEVHVWGDLNRARALGPNAQFRYISTPDSMCAGHFEEVIEESPSAWCRLRKSLRVTV